MDTKSELEKLGFKFVFHDAKSDIYAAIQPLMYTLAIAYDIDHNGSLSERYCFEDPTIALDEFQKWISRGLNDERPTGWVACRGVSSKSLRESFEMYQGKDYASRALSIYREKESESQGQFLPYEIVYPLIDSNQNTAKHLIAYLRAIGEI